MKWLPSIHVWKIWYSFTPNIHAIMWATISCHVYVSVPPCAQKKTWGNNIPQQTIPIGQQWIPTRMNLCAHKGRVFPHNCRYLDGKQLNQVRMMILPCSPLHSMKKHVNRDPTEIQNVIVLYLRVALERQCKLPMFRGMWIRILRCKMINARDS